VEKNDRLIEAADLKRMFGGAKVSVAARWAFHKEVEIEGLNSACNRYTIT
jgi:hypothetical protein